MKKVLFLDRDGVINRDTPAYITRWEDFDFLPGSRQAIRMLTDAGYELIVITNQSAVGRNMTSPAELGRIFSNMRLAIEDAGGKILDVFHCPHLPDDGCDCRKPGTGMIEKAAQKHGIDPAVAGFVGDSAKDILCAREAGCVFSVLVESGSHTAEAKNELAAAGVSPDHIAKDLLAAARWILDNRSR